MIHTHHLPLARENNPSAVVWQLLGRRSVKLIIAEESTDYKPIPLLFCCTSDAAKRKHKKRGRTFLPHLFMFTNYFASAAGRTSRPL